MFSKLVFTVNNQVIDFLLHEVVRIVMSILDDEHGEEVHISSPSQWNFIFEDIMTSWKFCF